MGFDEKTILKTVSNIKIKKKKKSNIKYQNENIINLNDFKYNLASTFILLMVNFYCKTSHLS